MQCIDAAGLLTENVQNIELEVDHVIVIVEPGAATEVTRLAEAGITMEDELSEHVGQGTASRTALFGGAYLELIWAEHSVALDRENESFMRRMVAADCGGKEGPSPLGVALRRAPGAPEALPFPTTPYRASWMLEEGPPIELIDESVHPGAILLFVVPPYMAMPSWEEAIRSRKPDFFKHGLEIERLTNTRLYTPVLPKRADNLAGLPGLELIDAERDWMELEFDGGGSGESYDLRHGLPLIIHR